MAKILIFENLDLSVSETDIKQSLQNIAQVDRINLDRINKYAFVFLKKKNEAVNLKKNNSEIKDNPNITVFNHSLARLLVHKSFDLKKKLLKKLENPEDFVRFLKSPAFL